MNNKNNVIITKEEVENIIYPYKVYDTSLYQRSFACQCFFEELDEQNLFLKSNETLETVGDSIISSIVLDYLEERYPEEREGFLSVIKMHITETHGLYLLAKKLNFKKYILISTETEYKTIKINLDSEEYTGRTNPQILEDCFEAFIGALYLDYKNNFNAGEAFNTCKKFLIDMFEKNLDFSELILRKDNYKNTLQHFFHTKKWPLPDYVDIFIESEDNDKKIYTKGIYLERFLLSQNDIYKLLEKFKNTKFKIIKDTGILIGVGTSYKKKVSDQLCAKDALEFFAPQEIEQKIEILFN